MKKDSFRWMISAQAIALIALLGLSASCSPTQPQQPAPVVQPPEVGRFQVVIAPEADRGSVLFLVDTKDGATWIYRPPQGPAINGFWSDIPRLTYAPDFWQRAFSQAQVPEGQLAPQPQGMQPPAGLTQPVR